MLEALNHDFQLMQLLCLGDHSTHNHESSTLTTKLNGGDKWIMYVLVDYQKT